MRSIVNLAFCFYSRASYARSVPSTFAAAAAIGVHAGPTVPSLIPDIRATCTIDHPGLPDRLHRTLVKAARVVAHDSRTLQRW
jgi:hypothetical protein